MTKRVLEQYECDICGMRTETPMNLFEIHRFYVDSGWQLKGHVCEPCGNYSFVELLRRWNARKAEQERYR